MISPPSTDKASARSSVSRDFLLFLFIGRPRPSARQVIFPPFLRRNSLDAAKYYFIDWRLGNLSAPNLMSQVTEQ